VSEARLLAQEQADRASVARAGDRSLRWVAQQHLAGQQPGSETAAVTPVAPPHGGGILGPQASGVADLATTPSAVEPDPGERPEA
jgi:hypothetical protein